MKQYIMLVDLDRCIGCHGGCQVACKMEHEIGLGYSRSELYTIGPIGTYPNLEMYFLPIMCQQCEQPACVAACPTRACKKNEEDGVIFIEKNRCIGCGMCKKNCPYGVIVENKEMKIMDKCTLCMERRNEGEIPACVRNCAGKALLCGDSNDPNSEVSLAMKAAGKNHVYALKDFGNHPKGRFILRGAKWVEELSQVYQRDIVGGLDEK